jgi:hypothetical protein
MSIVKVDPLFPKIFEATFLGKGVKNSNFFFSRYPMNQLDKRREDARRAIKAAASEFQLLADEEEAEEDDIEKERRLHLKSVAREGVADGPEEDEQLIEDEEGEEEEGEEEEEEEEDLLDGIMDLVPDNPPLVPPPKSKSKQRPPLRLMRNVMHDILRREYHCQQPLLEVDLAHCWFRSRKSLRGLCCICGAMTLVRHEKMTNYGLSCMNHEHQEFALDHIHNRAFRTPSELVALRRQLETHPMLLPAPVPCCYCSVHEATSVIFVYDEEYRFFRTPICEVDKLSIASYLSTGSIGVRNAQAVVPISYTFISRELDTLNDRRKKTRQKAGTNKTGTI